MGLLKLWKKIKWARRIVALFSIISIVLTIYLWLFSSSVSAEIIDPKNIGIFGELKESSTAASGSVKALLESCEKIAQYYKDHSYHYDSESGNWRLNYLQQTHDGSCCTIYAQQALYDAGILNIDEGSWEDIWKSKPFGDWLEANPDWYKLKEGDEEQPGDVHVYYADGLKSHTNIYAGDGQYWDAGDPSAQSGAFIAETKSHSWDYTYGIYRYIK